MKMSLRQIFGGGLVALTLLQPCSAAPAETARLDAARPDSSRVEIKGTPSLDSALMVLTPGSFAQLIVRKNVEVASSKLAIQISQKLRAGEEALYEPVATTGIRHERRTRLNTVEEQILRSELPILNEEVYSAGLGLKMAVPSGGNVKLNYQVEGRKNNVIALQSKGLFGSEYTGSLGLTFEQPLWRGAGRGVTETPLELAEFDYLIAREKFSLQVYKSVTNALDTYWQLYRWQRIEALRKESLDQSQRLLEASRQRIEAGRAASSNQLEVQSVVLARHIEYRRAQQSVLDATSNVMSLLGMNRISEGRFKLIPEIEISDAFVQRTERQDEVDEVLSKKWPTLRIADLERRQANLKSAYFANQAKPQVNLLLNYQSTGFAFERNSVNPLIAKANYPDWFIGVNVELPLGGNRKAKSLYLAQEDRLTQLAVEMEGLKVNHANEYFATREQLLAGTQIVSQSRADVRLREQLVANDLARFKLGNLTFAALAQKEGELLDAQVRAIDNEARLEYSKLLYLYYRDVALESYNIHLDN